MTALREFISRVPGLRWQWVSAITIAVLYALVTNAPNLWRAAFAGRGAQPILEALIQTAGTFGFALIAVGAALDFMVGLAESWRSGAKYDHD